MGILCLQSKREVIMVFSILVRQECCTCPAGRECQEKTIMREGIDVSVLYRSFVEGSPEKASVMEVSQSRQQKSIKGSSSQDGGSNFRLP